MKEKIHDIIDTLGIIEVSGRTNLFGMYLCINELQKIDKDEKVDIHAVIEILNQIHVSGKDNISHLCASIDDLTAILKENDAS